MDDELVRIGRFARLCGLSVGALRHYDELGLLAPARVDPESGYRLYRRDQVDAARTVARLRELDLPLSEIGAFVRAVPSDRRSLLERARSRTTARLARIQRQLHQLNRIIDHEEPIVTTAAHGAGDGADFHRRLAADLFNHVWTLLEEEVRTPAQDDEMIHAAHASRYHWGASGPHAEPHRIVGGEWQCSRVYAVLGHGESARWHAARALQACADGGITGFHLGAAHEAMARALLVSRRPAEATPHVEEAQRVAEQLDDADDREILLNDLESLPTGA